MPRKSLKNINWPDSVFFSWYSNNLQMVPNLAEIGSLQQQLFLIQFLSLQLVNLYGCTKTV
jgi:hypothetical protein